jgi:predicted nuclease of predicted toxin-antitoxin system
MRILVDENIPGMTVTTLRDQGHDVRDIRGTPDQSLHDDALWAFAQAEQRLLITTDKGFRIRRDQRHAGILIVRLRKPNTCKIHDRVMRAMSQFPPQSWPGLAVEMRDTVKSIWRAKP